MTLISATIGLFAAIGAGAALRWAFSGQADDRPVVDTVFTRIRSRSIPLDRRGVEGASEHLYPGGAARVSAEPEVHARGENVAQFRKRGSR